MKKNVLMKSKRMAAFALSLSMVLAEGSVAGATELNANPNPDSAVVTEADTEATEVDVQETETPAADQTTETASTEEASEQDAPEVAVPETEAVADEAVPTADEVVPVADEVVPEAEADTEETTEEETESADLEEDTEELGAYNGTPSKVIGLKQRAEDEYDGTKTINGVEKHYTKVNQITSVEKAGDLRNTQDANTGLYSVDGKNYAYASYWGGVTTFSGEVVATFPLNQPVADAATGLLLVDGVYYAPYTVAITDAEGNSTPKCIAAVKGQEAVSVGAAADLAAAEQAAGVVGEGYSNKYYVVNGKCYNYLRSTSILDGGISKTFYYVYDEISFDKVKPVMRWNRLTTDNVVVSGGKKLEIGYQVRVNGVEETAADFVAVDGTGTHMALRYEYRYDDCELNVAVGPGEAAKIEVRGVYYVSDKAKDAEGNEITNCTVVSVGSQWSEAYTFKKGATELKQVPQIGGLTAALDGASRIKLQWNPVVEAASTYLYEIKSNAALNLTPDNFGQYFDLAEKLDDDEDLTDAEKALLGTMTKKDLSCKRHYDLDENSYSFKYDKDFTYHYFAVKTDGTKAEGYENKTTYSNIAVVSTTKNVNIPTVTGFKSEKQSDGSYKLVWKPVDAENMVIYAYNKKTLPEFFNVDDLQAEGKNAQGETEYLSEQLTDAQSALKDKVRTIYVEADDVLAGTYTIPSYYLTPGVTTYFTAFTYDGINKGVEQAPVATVNGINFTKYVNFSQASATVGVKDNLSTVGISTKASKNSVKLTLNSGSKVTGYEIYRKNSKNKWKKIATTTNDVYTDSDLKENTKYSYRVRAYFYNKDTKKTIYSEYAYKTISISQVTDIAVKVTMKSTSQAKVTWTKVSKAEKYEIYRTNSTNVDPKVLSKKYYNTGDYARMLATEKFELVKTIKKAKTTSFTDKKLKSGETYTYVVLAYYKDGKTTGYIKGSDGITFAVQQPQNVQTENKGKTVKVTWDADKFASKFEVKYILVDKYGNETSRKWTVKSTKKNSYTVKGLVSGGSARIFVRAYGKNKTYSAWSNDLTNGTSLGVAKDIKAKNITETLTNGKKANAVKITWKKVSGAKYYEVYRSTKTAAYNKDEKKYLLPDEYEEILKESNDDESTWSGVKYKEYLDKENTIVGTSAIDRSQLLEGVTYYYSVVAYGEDGTRIASRVTTGGYATSKPASVVFNADLKIASLKNSKKGQVVVKYNKVNSAKQYVIYRAEKKNGTYKKLGTSKKTSYTDKKAKKGKTYYYKVVATGTNGAKANLEVTSSVKKIKVKK